MNFKLFALLFIAIHLHFTVTSQTCFPVTTSSSGFQVVDGPLSNICESSGTLEIPILITYVEDDYNVTHEYEIEIRYQSPRWVLLDIEGLDGNDSYTSGSFSGPNFNYTTIASLTLNGSGEDSIAAIYEVNFVFQLTDDDGNVDHFGKYESSITNGVVCSSDFYNLNAYIDNNTFFINQIIEENSPPLSQRTSAPVVNPLTPYANSLQIQDDFEVDVDFEMEASDAQSAIWYVIICENKNITVTNDATLTISHYDIMGNNGRWGSIIVEDGSTLIMNDCIIEGGVNNITIEDGGTLIIDDVIIKDGSQSGILLEDNAIASIENTTIEDCEAGLKIQGNPTINTFENNTFMNNTNGVRVENSSSQVDLTSTIGNENYFLDNNVGLNVSSGSVEISYGVFDDNLNSIYLWSSYATEIFDCSIGYINTAVTSYFSDFYVYDNSIGGTGVTTGSRAFFGIANENYSVNNNTIEANDLVSYMYFSNGEFDSNIIGFSSNPTRGLHHVVCKDEIADNDIYSSHTNILLNAAFDNLIEHNELFDADYGCFAIGGTTSSTIESNIIETDIAGVRLDNSGGNTTACNEIDSDRGIWINQNSDVQNIMTNELYGNNEDIYVESVLTPQIHHANSFFGETLEGNGLTSNEYRESRFIVDENEPDFIPNNVDPTELLDEQPFAAQVLNCNGTPGNNISQKFLDTVYICTYLDSTNSFKTTNTKLYWNRISHMMKFLTYKVAYSQWPNCVKTFWQNEDLCGLKKMVNNESDLRKYLSGELISYENVSEFRDSLYSLVNSQRAELSALECTEQITNLWIDTYLLLSKRIKGDSLNSADRSVLDSIASLCAYEFGDAVHWARSLIAEYSSTDYYTNDNCNINTMERSRQSDKVNFTKASIYPNPANGIINIVGDLKPGAKLVLTNISGQTIIEQDIHQANHELDVSSLQKGLYFITIYSSNKITISEKILVQ